VNADLSLIDKTNLDDITFFRQDRPRFTAMRPKRLSEELNTKVRNWEDGVKEYLLRKYENSLTNKEF
jgi:dTDP-4-dehydrorhamnose reductase